MEGGIKFRPEGGTQISEEPASETSKIPYKKVLLLVAVAGIAVSGAWFFLMEERVSGPHPATKYAKMYPFDGNELFFMSGKLAVENGNFSLLQGTTIPLEINVGVGDIDYVVGRSETLIVDGSSDVINKVRNRLEQSPYTQENYKGVEVWKRSIPGSPFRIAFLNGKIVAGQSGVSEVIDVVRSDVSTFYGKTEVKTLLKKLKYKDAGIIRVVNKENVVAYALSVKRLNQKQYGSYEGTWDRQDLVLFTDNQSAKEEIKSIRDRIESRGEYKEYTVNRRGKVVEVLVSSFRGGWIGPYISDSGSESPSIMISPTGGYPKATDSTVVFEVSAITPENIEVDFEVLNPDGDPIGSKDGVSLTTGTIVKIECDENIQSGSELKITAEDEVKLFGIST